MKLNKIKYWIKRTGNASRLRLSEIERNKKYIIALTVDNTTAACHGIGGWWVITEARACTPVYWASLMVGLQAIMNNYTIKGDIIKIQIVHCTGLSDGHCMIAGDWARVPLLFSISSIFYDCACNMHFLEISWLWFSDSSQITYNFFPEMRRK